MSILVGFIHKKCHRKVGVYDTQVLAGLNLYEFAGVRNNTWTSGLLCNKTKHLAQVPLTFIFNLKSPSRTNVIESMNFKLLREVSMKWNSSLRSYKSRRFLNWKYKSFYGTLLSPTLIKIPSHWEFIPTILLSIHPFNN